MSLVLQWSPLLLEGLVRTLALFFCVLPLGFGLAVILALARLSPLMLLRAAANIYIEFFRGVSLYVTLFWLYFALPFIGPQLTIWQASILGLTLANAAYSAEYIRASILAVPQGQRDAAVALNMTKYQAMRSVVFPQALVIMLPLFGNELIALLKGTSVASLIGLAELTEQGHSVIVRTYDPIPVLVTLLAIYFVLARLITLVMRSAERHLGRWRDPTTPSNSPGVADARHA